MTSTPVLMPQMGESIAEGTIVTWYKQAGDRVEKDEPLFEISTDKVDAEIPAPASGFLSGLLFGPGQTVEVNKVIAHITSEKGGAAGHPTVENAPVENGAVATATVPVSAVGPTQEELRKVRSSPLVRRLAQEHGVDIRHLSGSGTSGRVTKQDILHHLEGRPVGQAPVSTSAAVSSAVVAAVSAPAVAGSAADSRPSAHRFGYQPQSHDRAEPFSPMRASIADHMVISRETSVHVTTVFEVDMTRVAKLRTAHKAAYAARGVNLTFTPFILRAVAAALHEFPILNSSVVDKTVYYKEQINLGLAVSLDWGLLVPVIKRADELSLLGLSRTANDLAERARAKKLSPDEVQGGTFTVTNPGVFGSLFGTPIINQPQVAILGVGTITKRPVVTEDDAIAIRSMMYLALSFDHRVIDGATADRFMSRIKSELQNFSEGAL